MMYRRLSAPMVVSSLFTAMIGCGGPDQELLDRAQRETVGASAKTELSDINLPEHAVTSEDLGSADSYGVRLVHASGSDSGSGAPPVPQELGAPPPPDMNPTQTPTRIASASASGSRRNLANDPSSIALPPNLNPNGSATRGSIAPPTQLATPPVALEGSLTIGDAAPPLQVASFVKGQPVTAFEPGMIYIVEFWATWCGPCKMNMPHLTALQQELGDSVRVIGISDESEDKIRQFIASPATKDKTWDEVLGYTIAADANKATKNAYMQAAKERGIPCAFIIGGDGVIQWIGHPGQMDEPLAAIVNNQWNVAAARQKRSEDKQYAQAMSVLQPRLSGWLGERNYTMALAALTTLSADFPRRNEPLLMKLEVLRSSNQFQASYPLIATLVDRNWNDPNMLSQLAWLIAAESNDRYRDLDLALKAAKRSVVLTDSKSPIALDTAARACFEMRDYDQAVDFQTRAVALGGKFETQMRETLNMYKAALNR